jgi:ABC-2 type transport system permease protein
MKSMILKELWVLLRDRTALMTLFLSPLLFITVMSAALSDSFAELGDGPRAAVTVVDQDGGKAARNVIGALKGAEGLKVSAGTADKPLTRKQADRRVENGDALLVLVIPKGFQQRVVDGKQPKVRFVADPSASRQTVDPMKSALENSVLTVATTTRQAATLQKRMEAEPDQKRREAIKKDLDALDTDWSGVDSASGFPAGVEAVKYPSVYQQNVPGYTVMYVFFIVTVMAGSIMTERREGTFRRLLSAPVVRWKLLLGKVTPYLIVSVFQVLLLMSFGKFVFGMELGAHPLALLPITVAVGMCACALGLVLASFAKSEMQVNGLGTSSILVLAALGGCMVPSVFMPDFMRDIAAYTPHGQALQAFQKVMVEGAGVRDVLPASGILLAAAGMLFLVALPRFRFDK